MRVNYQHFKTYCIGTFNIVHCALYNLLYRKNSSPKRQGSGKISRKEVNIITGEISLALMWRACGSVPDVRLIVEWDDPPKIIMDVILTRHNVTFQHLSYLAPFYILLFQIFKWTLVASVPASFLISTWWCYLFLTI